MWSDGEGKVTLIISKVFTVLSHGLGKD